jgi:hypothetical protein
VPNPDSSGTSDHLTLAWRKASTTRRLPELSDAIRAILLMCTGVSTFPFMNAAVKLLATSYPASWEDVAIGADYPD